MCVCRLLFQQKRLTWSSCNQTTLASGVKPRTSTSHPVGSEGLDDVQEVFSRAQPVSQVFQPCTERLGTAMRRRCNASSKLEQMSNSRTRPSSPGARDAAWREASTGSKGTHSESRGSGATFHGASWVDDRRKEQVSKNLNREREREKNMIVLGSHESLKAKHVIMTPRLQSEGKKEKNWYSAWM